MDAVAVALTAVAGVGAAVPASRWINAGRWLHGGEPAQTRIPFWAAATALGLGGAVVGWALMRPGWWPAGVAGFVFLVAVSMAAVTDLAVQRVPEALVLPLQSAVVLVLLIGALVSSDWSALGRALGCGVAAWATMFLWALLSGGLGFGDVQLIGTAALALGWVSWPASLAVVVIALIVGGAWAIGLMSKGRRRGNFAFAPSIAIAFLAVLLVLTIEGRL